MDRKAGSGDGATALALQLSLWVSILGRAA